MSPFHLHLCFKLLLSCILSIGNPFLNGVLVDLKMWILKVFLGFSLLGLDELFLVSIVSVLVHQRAKASYFSRLHMI